MASQKETTPSEETKMGRPTTFTRELADRICEKLAEGKSMRTVCVAEDMPAMSTVFKWLRENEDFSEQYARAKQESADAMAEEILDIADNTEEGETVTEKADGTEVKRGDMLGHRKLKIDTRKWLMSKMKPKKYGDKVDVTSGDKPLEGGSVASEIVAKTLLAIYERNPITTTSQTPDGGAGSDQTDLS